MYKDSTLLGNSKLQSGEFSIYKLNCITNRKHVHKLLEVNYHHEKEGTHPHHLADTYENYLRDYDPKTCHFSTLVDYSIAYILSSLKTNYNPKHINIRDTKALLDANNPTEYTPIAPLNDFPVHLFKKGLDSELLRKSYLVVQYAYWLGSTPIENHFFISNLNHLFSTGEVIEYNGPDCDSYYNTIDRINTGEISNIYQITKQWFLSCIDMLHASLGYDINPKEKDSRTYNNMIQCPRILRYYVPLELVQCDIKSAHISFLDAAIGTDKGAHVYNNLMLHYNIDRPTAKRKFNSQLNKSKFRVIGTFKSKKSVKPITITPDKAEENIKEWSEVLAVAGYTPNEIEAIQKITSNKETPFHSWANRIEKAVIEEFAKGNELSFYLRGHDAVFYHDGYNKLTFDKVELKGKYICFDNELKQKYNPDSFTFSNLKLINENTNEGYLKPSNRITNKAFIDENLKFTNHKPFKVYDEKISVCWRKGSEREEWFYYDGYLEMLKDAQPAVKVVFKQSILNNIALLQKQFKQFIFLNKYASKKQALRAFIGEYRCYYYFNQNDAYNALFDALSFFKVKDPIIHLDKFQKGFIEGDDYIEFNSMVAIAKMKGELTRSNKGLNINKMLRPFIDELLAVACLDRRSNVEQKKQDLQFCATFGKFRSYNSNSSYCKDHIYQKWRKPENTSTPALYLIEKLKNDFIELRTKQNKQIAQRKKTRAAETRTKAIEVIAKLRAIKLYLITNAQAIEAVINNYNEKMEDKATKFAPRTKEQRPTAITPAVNEYTIHPHELDYNKIELRTLKHEIKIKSWPLLPAVIIDKTQDWQMSNDTWTAILATKKKSKSIYYYYNRITQIGTKNISNLGYEKYTKDIKQWLLKAS